MADLIIKPTAGSGNKLIFKDQAGNPIITTADSGGTIDSGVTWTSPVISTGISGSAVLDEDAMGSDSATKIATQQSIKAYVDSKAHLSLIDEDNMATDSATRPPSQQSVKAYADTKAPIAGPTFTGTVAIPNVANLETAVVANTAKVTNATHSGDVTGATALTIAAGAVDIAMLASGIDGELITWDASGDPAAVAVGTSGHVLTSGGTGVAPTFQSASSTGTLIEVKSYYTAASANWTKPTGCTQVKVYITGGGGGGGGCSGSFSGGGGGGGGTVIIHITNASSSVFNALTAGSGTVAYSVGGGGSGGSDSPGDGGAGGDSWFGTDSSNFFGKGGGGVSGKKPHPNQDTGYSAAGGTGSVGSSTYALADSFITSGGMGYAPQRYNTGGGHGGGSIYGNGAAAPFYAEGDGLSGGAKGGGGSGGATQQLSAGGGAGQTGVIIVESYT